MTTSILVVEDEPAILELVSVNLRHAGFQVIRATSAEEAETIIRNELPDLLVLDWMLPGQSGVSLARKLRMDERSRELPIIMLTARAHEEDKVQGLEAGADDYVTKPFSPKELVARVRAVLRRARPAFSEERLVCGDITMDLGTHRVTRSGRPIHLGPTEFRLLRLFLERPERVFTREQLLDRVWGRDIHVELRTVDVHIRRLRKALGAHGDDDVIRTVRGAGYALDAGSEVGEASA